MAQIAAHHEVHATHGACQRSCRLCYAAEADTLRVTAAFTTESRSGLRVTTAMGCQFRVCRAQRLGPLRQTTCRPNRNVTYGGGQEMTWVDIHKTSKIEL